MNKNRFYVYVYLDPFKKRSFTYLDIKVDYQPFYVGKGCGDRYLKHLWTANGIIKNNLKYDTRDRKLNKILSIKKKGLDPIILILKNNLLEQEAYDLETKIVDHWGRKDERGILFNYESGGRGGYTVSKETKRKMSKAAKGKIVSEETKLKMSISRTGMKRPKTEDCIRNHSESLKQSYKSGKIQPWNKDKKGLYKTSEETKKKQSKAISGRKYSKEHCENISKARKKLFKEGVLVPRDQYGDKNSMFNKPTHNSIKVVSIDKNGGILIEFRSAAEASRETGLYPAKIKEMCENNIEYKNLNLQYY